MSRLDPNWSFLFITATPLSPVQGSGTYVGIATLKSALEKLGHSVQILAPWFWSGNFVVRRYFFNRFLPDKIRVLCKIRHFDFIIGFDCDGFLWAWRRKISTDFSSIPYVVSVKGVLADEAKQEKGFIHWLLQLQAQWERRNVQNADLILVTSQYCQRIVEKEYQVPSSKIRVVPELIHIERWEEMLKNRSQTPIFSRTLHPAPRTPHSVIVLTVCRMYPRKNLGLLLRAWFRVIKRYPNAQLRIVGTGQEYGRWRKLAEEFQLDDSVIFLGDQTQEELAKEYRNCDLFCLPSLQEGFGIVFLEAMIAAKPIVATTAAAIPEVVHHNEQGFLVAPDSESELAEALLRLIESPELRQRFGEAGRERVRQFDALRVAEQFLSSIAKVQALK